MSLTVRIDEATHAVLRELAAQDDVSLQDELAKAVEALRRERFFAELQASFARMTPAERADYDAEAELFDQAAYDGMQAEDWTGFDAAPVKARAEEARPYVAAPPAAPRKGKKPMGYSGPTR